MSVTLEPRIVYPQYRRMLFKPLRQRERVADMPLHPDVQRFKPKEKKKCRKRTHACARVTQPVCANMNDVSQVSHGLEGLSKNHPVIRIIRGIKLGPFFRICRPEEFPAVYDCAADVHTMPAEEFGGRIDDNVSSMLDRTEEHRRQNRVVDNNRKPAFMGNLRNFLEIRHVILWITNRLKIDETRILIHQIFNLLRMIGIEKSNFNPKLFKGLGEKRPGPAVKARGGYKF